MTPGKISRAEAETAVLEFIRDLKGRGWTLTVTSEGTVRLAPKRVTPNPRD